MRFSRSLPSEIQTILSTFVGVASGSTPSDLRWEHRPRRIKAALLRLRRFLAGWYGKEWCGEETFEIESAEDIVAALLEMNSSSPLCPQAPENLAHVHQCELCRDHLQMLFETLLADLGSAGTAEWERVQSVYTRQIMLRNSFRVAGEEIPVLVENREQQLIARLAIEELWGIPHYVRRFADDLLAVRQERGMPLTLGEYWRTKERVVTDFLGRLVRSATSYGETVN